MNVTGLRVAIFCVGIFLVVATVSPVAGGVQIPGDNSYGGAPDGLYQLTAADKSGAHDANDSIPIANETDETDDAVPATLDHEDQPPPTTGVTPHGLSKESRQTAIIIATAESSINETKLQTLGATITNRHGRALEVNVSPEALSAITSVTWVESIRPALMPTQTATSEGVESIQADRLHNLNITGSGVKVGVLTLGVRPSSPEYADQVAASNAFHAAGIEGEDPTHGTAVTEIVSDTAPDAELYLTSFDSIINYADATSWLRENNVDVIVISAGWQSLPEGGNGYVTEVASNAAADDIVYATAAGNAGQKHWEGKAADTDGDSWIEIHEDEETNALGNGRRYAAGTEVRYTLSWEGPSTQPRDYTLYLLNDEGEVVAESQALGEFGLSLEVLQTTLPADGEYGFAIAGEESQQTLTVFGSDNTSPFEHYTTEGSLIAPATAEGVFAVGAYDVTTGRRTQYSSAGPTEDGRQGISLLAPTSVMTRAYEQPFVGTSAAAPHVGGAAALLRSLNRSASARTIETALTDAAIDLGRDGPDPYHGAGKLDTATAAEQLDPTVELTVTANRTQPAADQWVLYRVVRNDTGEAVPTTITTQEDARIQQAGPGKVAVYYEHSGEYILNVTPTANPPTADFASQQLSVDIRDRRKGTVSVLDVSKTTVFPGEPITISAAVANPTDRLSSARVTFYADGEVFKSGTQTIGPNESVVTIGTTEFSEPGTHTVRVNGLSPIQIDVRSNASTGTETGAVRGTVTAEDSDKIEGATVILSTVETNEEIRTTTTNQYGDYLFTGIETGRYQLRVRHEGQMKREIVRVAGSAVNETNIVFTAQGQARAQANITVNAPQTIPAGETGEVEVTVRNTGTATAGAGAIRISLIGPVSIVDVTGDGVNSPSRFFTAPIQPNGTRTTTYTIRATSAARGEATIQLTASVGTESTAESRVVTHVQEPSQTLGQYLKADDGEVTFQEVLKAIEAYNRDQQTLDGFGAVDFRDVLSAIKGYNSA